MHPVAGHISRFMNRLGPRNYGESCSVKFGKRNRSEAGREQRLRPRNFPRAFVRSRGSAHVVGTASCSPRSYLPSPDLRSDKRERRLHTFLRVGASLSLRLAQGHQTRVNVQLPLEVPELRDLSSSQNAELYLSRTNVFCFHARLFQNCS
jgi:hypothetical protein